MPAPCAACCCLCGRGRASTERRRHQLAQVYDEVCRKEWSERAARGTSSLCTFVLRGVGVLDLSGDVDFDVNDASRRLDPELLEQARTAYDGQMAAKTGAPKKGAASNVAPGSSNNGAPVSLRGRCVHTLCWRAGANTYKQQRGQKRTWRDYQKNGDKGYGRKSQGRGNSWKRPNWGND